MRNWLATSVLCALIPFAAACSSDTTADATDGTGGMPIGMVCSPGAPQSCVCADGMGTQLCSADGSQLEPCMCPGGPGAGGTSSVGGAPGGGGTQPNGGGPGAGGFVASTGGTLGMGGMAMMAGGAGGDVMGAGGDVGAGGAPDTGDGPTLPTPAGTCPDFGADSVLTFAPMGTEQRRARVITNPGSVGNGPLLVYWYGTGGSVQQVTSGFVGLGAAAVSRITAAGGVVVAPEHVNSGTFPWIEGNGVDHPLMDEIVACAVEKANIDPRRIHVTGFSAGALYTGQLGQVRGHYIASLATFSGGGTPPPGPEKFAALVFHGGPGDMVVLNFQTSSVTYHEGLKANGHFAAICNHGGGHSVPGAAVDGVITFFMDHPWGTNPSPYAGGLPGTLPSYCTL